MSRKKVYMPKDELKRRMEAGNQRRIKKGDMRDPALAVARADMAGAHFTKAQRKQFQALIEVAIYDLANYQWADWYAGIQAITQVMAAAGFQVAVVANTLKEIEHAAVAASGDKLIYRHVVQKIYEFRNPTKVISVAGRDPKHAGTDKAENNDPIQQSFDKGAARRCDERQHRDGAARRQKGSIH